MTISDEQLSAFLDAELPANEMEHIRQQLIGDETLANRLAELAMVDEQIAQHYSRIDTQPMPTTITRLLAQDPPATVITFPRWKKFQRGLEQHAAIAACTALVLGFGFAQLVPVNNDSERSEWNAIAQALDSTVSGMENILADNKRIKPRLTFINQEGNYCRQFTVLDTATSAENIACHINGEWQLSMTVYNREVTRAGDYQTATAGSLLDSALDTMMQGEAFDAQAEAEIISRDWMNKK
ncbi:MAG: hypothetical protein K0Q67_2324 [Cellvibrio sp.]|jgi:hypothetical protein|nr:hypothetical protein [Cellvibrio sp.]